MEQKLKSVIESQDNKRAIDAWNCVDYVEKECDSEKFRKEYRSCVLKLPVLILTNGLGQTLAFLKSKGKGNEKNAHQRVYLDIQSWLFSKESRIDWGNIVVSRDLIERVINVPSGAYRHITSETLAFLNWLKRFTEAALDMED